MSELRLSARLYIGALALAALAGLLVNLAHTGLPSGERALLAAVCAGFMTVAFLFPLPAAQKQKLYLDTSVLVAAILLFEPGTAMVIAGTGTFLAHAIRRQPWLQGLFDSAQTMLQALAGGLALAAAGATARPVLVDHPVHLLPLAGAAGAMYLVNTLAVSTIVGLQLGQPAPRVWWRSTVEAGRAVHLAHLAQLALGLLAALIADGHPWALALLVPPAVAVHRALEGHARLRHRAEEALHSSEASLAAAQRLAHLGSWEWDLATGAARWSDELYRIVGLSARGSAVTAGTFLDAVHPDDRELVERAWHDARTHGERYSVEHRIRRPDGAERVVHQ